MNQNNKPHSEGTSAEEEVQSPEIHTSAEHTKRHSTEKPIEPTEITRIADIQRMDIDQLSTYGKNIGLKHLASLTKSQMVFEIVKAISENPNEMLYGEGVLEILPDGFGFLRSPNYNYLPSAEDIYVSP